MVRIMNKSKDGLIADILAAEKLMNSIPTQKRKVLMPKAKAEKYGVEDSELVNGIQVIVYE
jgi:hypothetical protein